MSKPDTKRRTKAKAAKVKKAARLNSPRPPKATDAPPYISNWIVGFLDMLGYRSVLSAFDAYPLPQDPAEQERLGRALGRAVKLRRRLLKQADALATEVGDLPDEVKLVSPAQRKDFMEARKVHLIKDPGPDHIVLGTSLAPTAVHFPARGVYALLTNAALLTLMQLWIGGDDPELALPLRGGIALAPGMEAPQEKFLYSPALTCAYLLESETAKVPRIVVQDRVVEFLDAITHSNDPSTKGRIERTLAIRARALIVTDSDGKYILDFYGEALAKVINEKFSAEMSAKARKFVSDNLSEARTKDNPGIVSKYEYLHKYMEERAKFWPQLP